MGKEETQFRKGNPGRSKGSKNGTLTRERIKSFVDSNWPKFESELKGLKGRAFVENFLKLMPYITPAYSAVNFSLQNMSEEDLEYLLQKLKENFVKDEQ